MKGTVKPLGLGYSVVECDGEDINLPENKELIDNLVSEAKKIKGEVISQSLDVEYFINKLLEKFFFQGNHEQSEIFDKYILQKEFFTFGNKVRILRSIFKDYPEVFHLKSVTQKNNIIQNIQYVMEVRNKFAHREIIVNFKEKKPYIYNDDDGNLLSPESINKFYQTISNLSIVYMVLYTNLVIEITNKSSK